MTPGIDTAMVLRTSIRYGRPAGTLAAIGICSGLLLWGMAAALGLTALLAASEMVFKLVKWVGAAYLVYLGVQMLMKPRLEAQTNFSEISSPVVAGRSHLLRGFLSNILNPKVGLFYMTFLPQFIPLRTSVARFSILLAGIDVAMGLVWFCSLAALTVPLSRFLERPRVARNLDRLTGIVFVSFGLKLAIADRR
jgi:threonine/homoserine/homoserine lactone efflux protein